MKSVYRVWLLAGLTGFSVVSYGQEGLEKKPRISFMRTTVDIGIVKQHESRQAEFLFYNTGESPLEIRRILPTCSCISGTVEPAVVQPKGKGTVTLTLNGKLVHQAFKRSAWVESNDPAQPRVLIAIQGISQPPFEGLPLTPLFLNKLEAQGCWTNQFVLTATETNLFLGPPVIRCPEALQIAVATRTNLGSRVSYEIMTVIRPLDNEARLAEIEYPILGSATGFPAQVHFRFQTQIGGELRVTPSRILLNPNGKTITRSLLIQTSDSKAETNRLSWSPLIEGVDISFLPISGRPTIFLLLSVSDVAAQRLAVEKGGLTFSYPKHKAVTLPLEAAARLK